MYLGFACTTITGAECSACANDDQTWLQALAISFENSSKVHSLAFSARHCALLAGTKKGLIEVFNCFVVCSLITLKCHCLYLCLAHQVYDIRKAGGGVVRTLGSSTSAIRTLTVAPDDQTVVIGL